MLRLNKHFQRQFDSDNCAFLPPEVKDDVLADFQMMSQLGIENDEDQNKFFLIRNNVPEVLHLIFNSNLNDKTTRAITSEVFRNREKAPIGTLLELIEAIDLALKKMVPKSMRPKLAYPQPQARQQLPQYDIGRWVDATRKIYNLMVKGYTQEQAEKAVLGNWQKREKMDYEHWLKFYKEGGPEKYPKLASDADLLLGGIPVSALRGRIPNPIKGGQGHAVKMPPGLPQSLPHGDSDEVRDKIEKQRKRLVSRLNSAEKMLTSQDGQMFAGEDQELMLKLLQDLKRRIQTVNKRTVKSTLFEDHIYRTANHLKFQGRDKAAGFFYKLAQLPPLGGPPAPPGGDAGLPPLGGPDEMGGGAPPTGEGDKKETHDLLKEFFDNLKRGVSDKDDEPEERAQLEKEKAAPAAPATPPAAPPEPAGAEAPPGGAEPAPQPTAALEIDNQIKLGSGVWQPLTSLAQFAPPAAAAPAPAGPRPAPAPRPMPARPPGAAPAPPRPEPEEPAGDVIADEPDEKPGVASDNTDDVIEAALKNVSITDVVNRLEMLVSIYNQREISRQLAILDIMMDRIGLASFFPALGEAMSKALEANQYIGNRLQEILGKVKSSMEAPGASEWIEVTPKDHPETEGIRQRLEQKKQQEERRKEHRKEQELAKMEGRAPEAPAAAPRIGDAADLQRPSRVEKAPRLEVR